tara:strand:- start:296 stop:457 length:162 start_codon:yes stop_codon:yes gene_type:complete
MKILFIIALFWIFNQIRKFISGIQVSSNKKAQSDYKGRKEGMDIQDADYEDVE